MPEPAAKSEKPRAKPCQKIAGRVRALADRFPNRATAAEKAGISVSTLQNWIDGKYAPSFESIAHLAQAASIRVEWIATGQGPMEVGAPTATQQQTMGAEPPPALPPQAAPDADARLDAIESLLEGETEQIDVAALRNRPDLDRARQDLLWIARDERLPEAIRARADMSLQFAFGDPAATERRARFLARTNDHLADRLRRSRERLYEAENAADWPLPRGVWEMLRSILFAHPDIAQEDLVGLIVAIRDEVAAEARDPGQGG